MVVNNGPGALCDLDLKKYIQIIKKSRPDLFPTLHKNNDSDGKRDRIDSIAVKDECFGKNKKSIEMRSESGVFLGCLNTTASVSKTTDSRKKRPIDVISLTSSVERTARDFL
jgi:hypothetical protein